MPFFVIIKTQQRNILHRKFRLSLKLLIKWCFTFYIFLSYFHFLFQGIGTEGNLCPGFFYPKIPNDFLFSKNQFSAGIAISSPIRQFSICQCAK